MEGSRRIGSADPGSEAIATQAVDPSVADLGRRGGVWAWLGWRLLQGVAVLLAVSILMFLATRVLPADPAEAILGKDATPQSVARLQAKLGLDRSIVTQYFEWLKGVVHADFGDSLVGAASGTKNAVAPVVWSRFENTLTLLIVTALISLPLSILLGVLAAMRRDSVFDRTLLLVNLGLTAVPEFVIALLLAVLLATTVFTVLPAVSVIPAGELALLHPTEIVLPVITLVLAVVPYLYRLVRASMIDALESEYVAMARLKGLPRRTVTFRHALPNAMIPVIQASGYVLSFLLGGAVVVEYVFGYPGLGTLLTSSVEARDLPTIQACGLVFAAGVVVFNIAADFMTIAATPRLRTTEFRS